MQSKLNNTYMQRCLQLAQLGESYVAPNPMVGALLVVGDKIIGEGYHHRYGEPHAEPNAIYSVKDQELLKQATLYVSLEPCSHFGKTPPCANLIVSSGIPRVVIGTLDPNPKVSGRGVKILEDAGIQVTVGVMEKECRALNKRFFVFQEEKRPYVILKWAQTKDGFIDNKRNTSSEQPLIISNAITRQLTHKMRSENQAIMVSTNTIIMDNPSLTVRNWSGRHPVRIGIDRTNRIPNDIHLLDGKVPTLIFTENIRPKQHNTEFVEITFNEDCLRTILNKVYERNINSILVEGGAKLLNSFITEGLWDEANNELSEQCIGDGIKAPTLQSEIIELKKYEKHQWINFRNNKKQFNRI